MSRFWHYLNASLACVFIYLWVDNAENGRTYWASDDILLVVFFIVEAEIARRGMDAERSAS